jgi:flagellar assembly protein FliH
MGGVIRRESVSTAPAFSFCDVEREAAEIVTRARAEADRLITDARQGTAEAEAQVRQQREARAREGYERGLAEGRQAGLEQIKNEARQAAMQAAQDELTRLTHTLAAGLADYERNRRGLVALAESGLIELSVAIARRVCKTLAGCSTESARANARALLEQVKHYDDLELHVHPDEHALLSDVTADFTQQIAGLEHVTVVGDPAVERGGCVLRTRDGTIDASITAQIDRVAAAICESCPPAPGAAPAQTPSPRAAEPPSPNNTEPVE